MKQWVLPPSVSSQPIHFPSIDFEVLDEDEFFEPNERKVALLRKALSLAKSQRGSEAEIARIITKAVNASNYELAFEAVKAFGPVSNDEHSLRPSGYYLCDGIASVLQPRVWSHLSAELLRYCEKRLLAFGQRRGLDEDIEYSRSVALGRMGLYHFCMGRPEKAFELWQVADSRDQVDEAISEFCVLFAEVDESHFEVAMAMTELINSKKIKSEALIELSDCA